MRDSRKSPLLILLLALFAAALAVSWFFLPGAGTLPDSGLVRIPWLSSAAALACIALAAVSMGMLNYKDFLYTSDVRLLYLPYILSVLCIPGVMHLSVWHIASVLMLWSLFYAVRYLNSEEFRADYMFGAMVTAGTASALVPCLTYAQIFIFLHCLFRRGQEPMRQLIVSVAGAAVPLVYVVALAFFFPDSFNIGEYAAGYRDGMALSLPATGEMPVVGMVWAGFALILGLRAVLFAIYRSRERNKAQKNSFGLSVALSVIYLLVAVFCRGLENPLLAMTAAVPLCFVVFDLFTNGGKAEVSVWIVLLLLLAAVSRILEFFPGLLPF